jgi:predicted nucleic acid-binding protein
MCRWRKPEADADGCGQLLAIGRQPEDICSAVPPDCHRLRRHSSTALPGVEMPSLGTEWPILRQLCTDKNLVANDIPDAWLAAAVIQLGEHLVTFDADCKKLLRRTQVTVLSPD